MVFVRKDKKKVNLKNKVRKISVAEHKINKNDFDINAVKAISRLNSFGYQGYIVGGAVRDLLLGKKPKDFDVVTDATPNQLKRIFKNSRIIGRRFKLVHLYFKDCIVETATFRTDGAVEDKNATLITRDNAYGTIEDDVIRRDFSINALYYDPTSDVILDFVGGYDDILNRTIRPLKDEKISFLEDPVRMLRAVKYSSLLNCRMTDSVKKNIKKYGKEIVKCSPSRLYEEFNKIFRSGNSAEVFKALSEIRLLKYLIPFFYDELKNKDGEAILGDLKKVDMFHKDQMDFDFEYEIYWGVMLYRKLLRTIDTNDTENLLDSIRAFMEEHLSPLSVPRKVSEDLAKGFYIYIRYANENDFEKIKKFRVQYSFGITLKLFDIYCSNTNLLDKLKGLNYRKKVIKIEKREYPKKNYAVDKIYYKGKRFVETTKNKEENSEVIS